MLDEAQRVQKFIHARTADDMETDDMLAYAVVRAIEIIGEAAAQVSPELRADTPQIAWRNIIGMRNIIVHAYADLSYPIIWDVATLNLPELIHAIEQLLKADG